ncbi:hypothetical protein K2Z84_19435 [Candidatus Binatia bacterium]|nr:hypothetical protein [Candidatus Binatia bacterium]
MRARRVRRSALIVALGIAVGVAGDAAAADSRQARTCITTLQTDKGPIKVLRKIGPKQTCAAGETLYTWDRTGFTVLTGATGKRIATGDGAQYSGPGTGVLSPTKQAAWIPVSGGTLRNLRVQSEVLGDVATVLEARVVVGEFETTLGCTISFLGNFCTSAGPVDVNAGDVVSVKIVETGASFPTYVSYSLELAPPAPQ